MAKHISYNCKCKFNSATLNSTQKWNNETCECECKIYRTCKQDYSWNPSTCICGNDKYLKSIADFSVVTCDETISVILYQQTLILTNVTSTASINCHSKK